MGVVLLSWVVGAGRVGMVQATAEPLPADPLSVAEVARASDLALQHPDVQRVVAKTRYRIIFEQRRLEEKPKLRQEKPPRRADVVMYVYSTGGGSANSAALAPKPVDRTVHVVVDIAKDHVSEVRVLESVPPPVHPDEQQEALQIALRDPRVLKRLGLEGVAPDKIRSSAGLYQPASEIEGVDPKAAPPTPANQPCLRNRCLRVFLQGDRGPLSFLPLVNLSRQVVDRIEELK